MQILTRKEEVGDHQQGGNGHDKPAHEVLEELSANISRRWLGGYVGLETLPGIVGTAMLGVSVAEMMINEPNQTSPLTSPPHPSQCLGECIWRVCHVGKARTRENHLPNSGATDSHQDQGGGRGDPRFDISH